MGYQRPVITEVTCRCGQPSRVSMAGRLANYCPNCGNRIAPVAVGRPKHGWTMGRLAWVFMGVMVGMAVLRYLPDSGFSPPQVPVNMPVQPAPPVAEDRGIPAPSLPSPVAVLQGDLELWTQAQRMAPFTVRTPAGENGFYIKLVDANTNQPVMSLFVYPGQEYKTTVPLGAYKLRYAYGPVWYGAEALFGPRTTYMEGDRVFNFTQEEQRFNGHIVSLINQPMGNMHPRRISRQVF